MGANSTRDHVDEKRRAQRKNHLTILAASQQGYRNLLNLSSLSYSQGFYYEPTISPTMLREHKDGLIILSGCQGSALFTALMGGKLVPKEEASYEKAKRIAWHFKQAFGDAYYVEVQAFPELESTCDANPLLARIAEELQIPLVATFDCHYTLPTERELQKILHAVRPGERRTLEEMERDWGYDAALCTPVSDATVIRKLEGTGLTKAQSIQAAAATEEIASRCSVELPRLDMVRFPLPPDVNSAMELWRKRLKQGWEYRGLDSLSRKQQREYKERIKYERSIIEPRDFIDYFLIVADIVSWAKDNGVAVGPARGSAAASLLCWLLRITEVNPMLFPNLVFERFIDVTREDLPDIDLDFDSDTRHLVRARLVEKYGEGQVCNIGTFSTFKAKVSLDDVGRVHKVPYEEVEKIKTQLIERSSGDLRASSTVEDTILQFDSARQVIERFPDLLQATELEGNIRGFGTHAAGLVVSTGPIKHVAPVVERKIDGRTVQVIEMDKDDAERQGLLKLDFLGLNTITMVTSACESIGMKHKDLYKLPLDDEKVLGAFRDGDVVGIFQFEGQATRAIVNNVEPDTFGEICDIGALSRPGPLHSGATAKYIQAKRAGRLRGYSSCSRAYRLQHERTDRVPGTDLAYRSRDRRLRLDAREPHSQDHQQEARQTGIPARVGPILGWLSEAAPRGGAEGCKNNLESLHNGRAVRFQCSPLCFIRYAELLVYVAEGVSPYRLLCSQPDSSAKGPKCSRNQAWSSSRPPARRNG